MSEDLNVDAVDDEAVDTAEDVAAAIVDAVEESHIESRVTVNSLCYLVTVIV